MLQNVRCDTVIKMRNGAVWDTAGPDMIAVEFPYNPVTRRVEMPIYEVGGALEQVARDAIAGGIGIFRIDPREYFEPVKAKPLSGCTVCGATLQDPCDSIEKAGRCDLPPGTVFVVDMGQDRSVRMTGRRVQGVTEFSRILGEGVTSPAEPVSPDGLYSAEATDTFEPIGDAAARVIEALTVGGVSKHADDLSGLVGRGKEKP
jgi:hypothetical protein